MTDYVVDTFTDTNGTLLESHTGETAASWSRLYSAWGGQAEVQGNAIQYLAGSGGTPGPDDGFVYRRTGTAIGPSAYDIEIYATFNSPIASDWVSICDNGAGHAAETADLLATNIFYFGKSDASNYGSVVIGSQYAPTIFSFDNIPDATEAKFVAQIRGITIEVFVNDISVGPPVNLPAAPDKDYVMYVDLSPGDANNAITVSSFKIYSPVSRGSGRSFFPYAFG